MQGKSQEPGQGLATRLVDVATDLIAQPRELKLATMREIAKAAGVTPGATYRHFASQDELFLAVVTNLFDQLEKCIHESVLTAANPFDRVAKTCEAYATWALNNPGGYQLLFETTDDLNLKASKQRPGLHLIDYLAQLLAEPSAYSKDHYLQATRIWTSLHGLVSLRIHKLGMTWPTTLDDEIQILIKNVASSFAG